MRWRKVPPRIIVNSLITSTKAGLNLKRDDLEAQILEQLRQENGRLDISDKSPPEEIFAAFKVSKKNFKRALGSLYKQRLIKISPGFIELV